MSDKKVLANITRGTVNFCSTFGGLLERMDKMQAEYDELLLQFQQKNAKVVESKPEVVVHDDELQVVDKKHEMEVQETKSRPQMKTLVWKRSKRLVISSMS